MPNTNNTQVFSVFGGGYVPESHGDAPAFLIRQKGRTAKYMMVAGLLVWGVSAATAITKSHVSATEPSWSQHSNHFSSPFHGGFEAAVY